MRLTPYAAAIALMACASAQAAGEFIPLETPEIKLTKISQNGEYASAFLTGTGGIRWVRATGAEEPVAGMNYSNGINNAGTITGSVGVNGGSGTDGGTDVPALSPLGAAAPQQLPLPADTQNANVYDVSDDGSAVGLTWASDWSVSRAYYYSTADGAVVQLPVDTTTTASRANSISGDGSVIAGWNDDASTGARRGVVWVNRVAVYPTVSVGGVDVNVGEGSFVSANGQWVVGNQYPTDDGSDAGWRFNVATGELSKIPVIPFVFGVSDDGKTAVGASGFFSTPSRAHYIWTEAEGTVLFSDYLAARGIEVPAGWEFQGSLSGISGDGKIVGGWTIISPTGNPSFIVTGIDSPVDKVFKDGFDGAPVANPVQDSGFEASISGSGPWTSTSTNFGTALCNAQCGDGGGTASAHDGSAWAWFGGAPQGAAEDSTVSQSVTIPSGGSQYLNFWLWIGAVNGSDSVLKVSIDGTEVAAYPEPTEAEAGYTQRSVDISTYADGAAHTIEFHYTETGGIASNYSLDDVTVDATQPPARAPVRAPQRPAGTVTQRKHR